MNELLTLLAESLGFLLEPNRFRIVDSRTGERTGDASLTLASSNMRLQLVSDRAEVSVRLQPGGPPGDWFWIGVVRRALLGERPGSDTLDAQAVGFLRTHIADLEDRCADERKCERLVRELQAARDSRASELFGQPPL